MTEEERKAQDNALKHVNKKVEATRIQRELCDKIFSSGLLELHGILGSALIADLMTLNTHKAGKQPWFVMKNHNIDWNYQNDFKYSEAIYQFNKENKTLNKKSQLLREVAEIFATMADTFEVIDNWSEKDEES